MSIEIKINKDVGSYEAKFIGPFTKRQDICIALAAPVCWWIYFDLAPIISKDIAGFLVFIPAVLAALFGRKLGGLHSFKRRGNGEKYRWSAFCAPFSSPCF